MPHKDKEKHKAYCRERYHKLMQENPESNKEYYKKHREKLIAKSRTNHLRISYNLSLQDYDNLVLAQNNLCAICNLPEHRYMKTGKLKPLSVDHNHTTGKVRQLLCNDCNAALGFAKENPELLHKMASYLEKHND